MAGVAALAVAVASLAAAPPASADAQRASSGVGVAEVEGRAVLVEALVQVAPGEDAEETTEQALRALGARPIREQPQFGFALTAGGIHWPQFGQPPRKRQSVPVSYNAFGDRTGGAAGTAFTAASATWSGVRSSAFGISDAGPTDRCPSIFCGGELDGANDVGWADLGPSGVLAVTGISFFTDSLEIIEADIAFNTAQDFSTDGTGFDVETVMLHELGHLAGLGHISDEDALMYPFLNAGEIQRELSQSEIDGIGYLYPKAAHPRPGVPLPPAPPVRASVVASLGDPAPAGGELSFHFEMGGVSDAGHAAFTTDVAVAGSAIGQVALRAGPSGLVELARSGGTTPSGGSFGLGTLGPIALTSSGDAVFGFLVGPFEPPFGLNGGVFHSLLAGGTAELATPGTATPAHGRLLGAFEPDASDAGAVVFTGIVRSSAGGPPPSPPPAPPSPPGSSLAPPTTPPLAEGVFEVGLPGGVRAVAAPGDPAPGGGSFGYAAHPATNAAGEVAFDAARGGCSLEFRSGCRTGVYLRDATGGIEQVVVPEQQAPGGKPGRVRAAAGPVLNDAGDIAFTADLEDAGRVEPVEDEPALSVEPITQALYLRSGAATRELVRTGDELPHGSHVWALGGRFATGRPFWTLNDRGEVAFVATLTDSVFGDGVESNGVYVFDGTRLRLIARSGTRVIGLGTIRAIGTLLRLPEGTPSHTLLRGGVALADNGDAVFPVTLTDGRVVLLRTHTPRG